MTTSMITNKLDAILAMFCNFGDTAPDALAPCNIADIATGLPRFHTYAEQ